MNPTQRLKALLAGEVITPAPHSFWTHFPNDDLDDELLAKATVDFCAQQEVAFIKHMANGLFSVEDYGCTCDFSEIKSGGTAKVTKIAVSEVDGWEALPVLNVTQGALGRELRAMKQICQQSQIPVLATLFSPLTTAAKLSNNMVLTHMREHPEKVKRGLEIITAATIEFARQALSQGCAGIYLATQHACYHKVSVEEYQEFGAFYDLQILNAVKDFSWFNICHAHGDNIIFEVIKDYPVQGISWHIWETAPSIEQFREQAPGKIIVGGLSRSSITTGNKEELAKNLQLLLEQAGNTRLIVAPDCIIRAPFDPETLQWVRGFLEDQT